MGLFILLMRTGLDREDRNTLITLNPYAAELFRNMNCFGIFFIHLKLELLQMMKKCTLLRKYTSSKSNY